MGLKTVHVLRADDAQQILAAACTEAGRRSLEVSVAVGDAAGVLLALQRLDGARLHTPDAATLKARTAAITRTATSELQAAIRDEPALLLFPGRMPLARGVPLVHDGEVVGGVGCSGGAPNEDKAVCQAGVRALAEIAEA